MFNGAIRENIITINYAGIYAGWSGYSIAAANSADGDYLTGLARDSDTDALVEVYRMVGAADPEFRLGNNGNAAIFTNGGYVGFYGTAAIAQQTLATGAGATVDNVITALQNLGLVKQS